MRGYGLVRRCRVMRGLEIITAALAMVGASLVFVSSSSAASQVTTRGVHQVGPTLNVWEAGVIDQGVGRVGLDGELAPGVTHEVDQSVDLGPVAFQPLKFGLEGRATGRVTTVFPLGKPLLQVEAPPTFTDMALVRYRPDGTVAASLTTDFNGTGDFGRALAVDSKGRIVAAGTSGDQFALMRANL